MAGMLSFARLVALLEVSRTGSISAAAKKLQLTPSAVSHQISTLERELETRLIERGPRGVWLTAAGSRLAEHSESVAELMQRAEQEIRELGGGERGRLSLGFFASAGLELVPTALSAFMAGRPHVELNLIPGQPHELVPRLLSTELDVAVVFDYSAGPPKTSPGRTPKVTYEPLLVDPHFIAVPPGYRPRARGLISIADLSGEQWIATEGMDNEVALVDRICAAAGYTPNVRCRTDHYDVTLGMVSAGIGFALVPALSLGPVAERSRVPLRTLSTPHPSARHIRAATRADNPNPLVPAFMEHLRDTAQRLDAEMRQLAAAVDAASS
ncbi:LysR family transcriptional regulator [Arthrobacter luteolus]|uniref:LysR family transcriptional regulator n=1 Tax=Arthrobacter luteolus TaxID=98672 RepID=UPI00082C07F3|nr:LysR family transcriptional regulator [Arthrobacter luteolus]